MFENISVLIPHFLQVSLLDIVEHFKGSKEESVLDLLNHLEGEFVIFKRNDLYKVM